MLLLIMQMVLREIHVSGQRSRYIIEERVINTKRFNANSVINTKFGDNIDFTAGASYQIAEKSLL